MDDVWAEVVAVCPYTPAMPSDMRKDLKMSILQGTMP
jgi:hypothetical protein